MKHVDVMPLETTYEDFKKYLNKMRKEHDLALKWNDVKKALDIDDCSVFFRDYVHCMCYLEGYIRGVEYGNSHRE